MTNLLQCPFCGGEADIDHDHTVEENHAYGCRRCGVWFDSFHHADAITAWNTRSPQWRTIDSAPRDGIAFEAWHVVWKCVVTVRRMDEPYNGCDLIEHTMANTWPIEAFSHWRPASTAP